MADAAHEGLELTSDSFGRDILGPIVAEFCLRLWSIASLVADPGDTALLFCARGGLRLQLAYERFLAAGALSPPTHTASLMVSRLVAVRPAVLAATAAAKSTLAYEFSSRSVAEVAHALAGIELDEAVRPGWEIPYNFDGLTSLLSHRDGHAVSQALAAQSALFTRHLVEKLAGRRHAVLVDTGLYGTTMQLLSMAGTTRFSCAMMARSNYRDDAATHFGRTFGLCVEADRYQPWRRRTAILRYWHLIESVLEPDLPSVREFTDGLAGPRCNLEVEGWRDRVDAEPGSFYSGILSYIDALPRGPAAAIIPDAARAWHNLARAVVWPDAATAIALDIGRRTHDFGLDEGSSARPWAGALAALRGHSLWREGEIARSESVLRLPLLATIETAYGLRYVKRAISRKVMSGL